MNLAPGQIILDSYEIIAPIGSNGSRESYRARDQSNGSNVVLRILSNPNESGLQTRFNDEALALSRVDHAHVSSIRHFGLIDDQVPCIVLTETNGPSLAEFIAQQGPMDWPDAVHLICQVLDGLAALHRERLIHRDVCTASIQLIHGDPSMPLITDFGIAQGQSPYDTKLQNGWVSGNPGFMSPEQLYGLALDERSDVYSAALVLYSSITGHTLEVSSARDALEQRVMNRLPPMNPGPPSSKPPVALKDLITGALEPDPALRPQNAIDFSNKLRAIAQSAGHDFQSQPTRRRERSSSRVKVSTAPPKKGWKPPSWAKRAAEDGDPKKRPVSARLQTVKADDILSSEAAGHNPPTLPPEAPPPLPMEEVDDIFDADILSEEVAEETELDILSENPVFEEIPNDGEFNIDGLEMGSSQPLAGDGRSSVLFEDDDDDDDDFDVPAALQDFGSPAPASQAIPQQPPLAPSQDHGSSSGPPSLDTENDELPGFTIPGGSATTHAVIVARVPPKQLRLPSEARWLKEQIGPHSHGMTVGQNMWVGTIVTETKEEAEKLANQAKVSMAERYGDYYKGEWTPVTEDFEASSSNVLPSVVEGLIHYLSH